MTDKDSRWLNYGFVNESRPWWELLDSYRRFPMFETETKFEPAVNVTVRKNETPTSWTFSYAVPGLTRDDLEITFLDSKVTVACLGNEFFAGFTDVISACTPNNAGDISAVCKNGILTITIQKPKAKTPIKIPVI